MATQVDEGQEEVRGEERRRHRQREPVELVPLRVAVPAGDGGHEEEQPGSEHHADLLEQRAAVERPSPPAIIAPPSTSSAVETIGPVSEPRTTFGRPLRTAKSER